MRFERRIHIAAAPRIVWAVWADVARWEDWTPTVAKADLMGDGPFAVGLRARLDLKGAGDGVWTVVALEEGRSFSWANDYRGVHTVAHHLIEPAAGDGCDVTLAVEYSGFFAQVFRARIRKVSEENLQLEADGLKRHCEQIARGELQR